MAAIDPFTDVRLPTTTTPPAREPDDQFGKDTFLKLLVAQLRFQNPLSPADPGDFMAQTAQFTMVEKLIEIQKISAEAARANQVLASSALIGRVVTFAIGTSEQATPIATTEISAGGNLPAGAATGSAYETNTDVYTADGLKVPLRLQFTRTAGTGDGSTWDLRAYSGSQQLGASVPVTFDATGERTSGAVTIPASALATIPSAAGPWPAEGIALDFGDATDPARLRVGTGVNTLTVREQNGSDGNTLTGIVTGIRFGEDGAILRVGSREVSMGSVLEVHPTVI